MQIPHPAAVAQWPRVNFEDPETKGPALLVVSTIMTTISTVTVVARVSIRLRRTKSLGLDDLFLCIALLFSVVVTVGSCIGSQRLGWDRHIWDITPPDLILSQRLAFVLNVLFTCAGTAIQLAWLSFYYTLVHDGAGRYSRPVLHAVVALAVLVSSISIAVTIFQCRPNIYNRTAVKQPKCVSAVASFLVGCVTKTCMSFIITTLPAQTLLRKQFSKQHPFGILTLIFLGYLVTGAGAVRTYYAYRAASDPRWDRTWWQYPALIAATVENNLAIISACMLTLGPLAGALLSRLHCPKLAVRSGSSISPTAMRRADESSKFPPPYEGFECFNEPSDGSVHLPPASLTARRSASSVMEAAEEASPNAQPERQVFSGRFNLDIHTWSSDDRLWSSSIGCLTAQQPDVEAGYGGDRGISFPEEERWRPSMEERPPLSSV